MSQQPAPIANDAEPTWDAVIRYARNQRDARAEGGTLVKDYNELIGRMIRRNALGIERYGVPLQPDNGRDSILDALEELLDGSAYLHNAAIECDDPRLLAMSCEAVHFALRLQRIIQS
jgi:hypothetical protein